MRTDFYVFFIKSSIGTHGDVSSVANSITAYEES